MEFGKFLKELRLEEGLGLREFSRLIGENPSNILNIEAGRRNPPQRKDRLAEFARCLNVDEGSLNWDRFFRLANSIGRNSGEADQAVRRPLVLGLLQANSDHQFLEPLILSLTEKINHQRKEVVG